MSNKATPPASLRDKRVYIAYTGGTIGMRRGDHGYEPAPGYLSERLSRMPQLDHPGLPRFELHEYEPLLDSSNVGPAEWSQIAADIAANYDEFDGFVVLHGTDTMAYTASALSFMLDGLAKPVILTGSQIPLVEIRSDARENLVTSMILATSPQINEVCIYLNGSLLRGNRAKKLSASGFDAFASPNFPPLGTVGVDVKLRPELLLPPGDGLEVHELLGEQVAALRLFPGISARMLDRMLDEPLRGVVLETFGAGNAPARDGELLASLERASERGIVLVNCTQCIWGAVDMSDYATGSALAAAGVVSGRDMTVEAALTKLSSLFSRGLSAEEVCKEIGINLKGEISD